MNTNVCIRRFEPADMQAVIRLWNEAQAEGTIPYKPLSQARFHEQFIMAEAYDPAYSLVATMGDEVVGFINGAVITRFLPHQNHDNTPGFINVLVVEKGRQRQGIGRAMVTALEEAFGQSGKTAVAVSESSPIQMAWLIPGTPAHDHNKAPGVDMESPGFEFMKALGYMQGPCEVAMYLNLKNYVPSVHLEQMRRELLEQGIFTGLWDTGNAYDYDRMCDRVGSEYWRHVIKDELKRASPRPMPVAVSDQVIVGFTGPVDREASGRGWFSGICTDPEFERRGIATVLFNLLMQQFIEVGAEFSTLFTGDTNHAQRIYLRTGFRVAKRFAIMKKTI